MIPVIAGITGDDYTEPAAFGSGFRAAMVIGALLLVVGGLVAFALIRGPLGAVEPIRVGPVEPPPETGRIRLAECLHCAVTGPQMHPGSPRP